MSTIRPDQMSWPVQEAKARFSELLDTCQSDGPQVVTRHGRELAVLVAASEWRRLSTASRRTLKQLLLSDEARGDIPIPARGKLKWRAPPNLS